MDVMLSSFVMMDDSKENSATFLNSSYAEGNSICEDGQRLHSIISGSCERVLSDVRRVMDHKDSNHPMNLDFMNALKLPKEQRIGKIMQALQSYMKKTSNDKAALRSRLIQAEIDVQQLRDTKARRIAEAKNSISYVKEPKPKSYQSLFSNTNFESRPFGSVNRCIPLRNAKIRLQQEFESLKTSNNLNITSLSDIVAKVAEFAAHIDDLRRELFGPFSNAISTTNQETEELMKILVDLQADFNEKKALLSNLQMAAETAVKAHDEKKQRDLEQRICDIETNIIHLRKIYYDAEAECAEAERYAVADSRQKAQAEAQLREVSNQRAALRKHIDELQRYVKQKRIDLANMRKKRIETFKKSESLQKQVDQVQTEGLCGQEITTLVAQLTSENEGITEMLHEARRLIDNLLDAKKNNDENAVLDAELKLKLHYSTLKQKFEIWQTSAAATRLREILSGSFS